MRLAATDNIQSCSCVCVFVFLFMFCCCCSVCFCQRGEGRRERLVSHRGVSWKGPEVTGGSGVGLGWEALYLALHCHPQQDFGIKMASNKSHFNVSLTVRAKPQDGVHKPKPLKREYSWSAGNRTEVLQLTSLTPYRQADLTGPQEEKDGPVKSSSLFQKPTTWKNISERTAVKFHKGKTRQ